MCKTLDLGYIYKTTMYKNGGDSIFLHANDNAKMIPVNTDPRKRLKSEHIICMRMTMFSQFKIEIYTETLTMLYSKTHFLKSEAPKTSL